MKEINYEITANRLRLYLLLVLDKRCDDKMMEEKLRKAIVFKE